MFYLKSLFWQIVNSLIKICLEIFIIDKKIRRILKGTWAKFYLRKYVKDGINHSNYSQISPSNNEDFSKPPIWQYWESKDGTIPPLVQACLNSAEKYKGDRERILLTPKNVKKYVDIPQIFWDLKEKGVIKLAFFSDILRTCLLLQNGGTWIDSTVLLTENLPEYISNSKLFVFQNDLKIDLDGLNMASYFIHANKGNHILAQTLCALEKYWKENRFLVNYFTYLHTFTMVTQANKENKEYFKQIQFFSFLPVQQMQNELLNKFDNERWKELKKMSPIHKLTHKQSVLTKEKNVKIEGTLFEHIIKEFS